MYKHELLNVGKLLLYFKAGSTSRINVSVQLKLVLARSSHFYLYLLNPKNDADSSGTLSTNEFHNDHSSTFQKVKLGKKFVLVVLQSASFFHDRRGENKT